jgi:hypothetical protein
VRRWWRDGLAGVALLAVSFALPALAGCGGTPTDANEPNDDLAQATELAPGAPLEGVIGADDGDIFACDAPDGAGRHPFVVTVRTDAPEDVELQVGASIPDVWEAITWPGWDAVVKDDRVELAGELRKGAVIMTLGGEEGTVYTIEIAWR